MTNETNAQVPAGYRLVPVDILEDAARWMPDMPPATVTVKVKLFDLLAQRAW